MYVIPEALRKRVKYIKKTRKVKRKLIVNFEHIRYNIQQI